MESIRQKKINNLIKEDLADIFRKKDAVCFPGQMVTVTDVKISPDLGIAKVALSLFPEKEIEFKKLATEYTKEIRFELGKKAGKQLRVVPSLIFYLDESLGLMAEIDQALKQ
ncbi:MAG: ribosome-binding factor A [Flavobacteriales bacterium]